MEVNFDGIVGPTHNYAGLSWGNLASARHFGSTSSPRRAALQGLEKMKCVHDLGIPQAVLPPQRRPRLDLLRDQGFGGSDQQIIESAWRTSPVLVAACFSASNMWTANAATVSPSVDCQDGRLHLTPANLFSGLHRSIEACETEAILRAIFSDDGRFCVHPPLAGGSAMSDEGAANHMRLTADFGLPGLHVFVFGQSVFFKYLPRPALFPARQTVEASQAIARRHGLATNVTRFIQQNPAVVDAGVFHNDVIAVANRNMLMIHELAFQPGKSGLDEIRNAYCDLFDQELSCWCAQSRQLSVDDAVNSYLFNSQLLSRPDGGMTLLCPSEVESVAAARACADEIAELPNPVDEVRYMDLRQSMNNGGGPACLRLRVVMTQDELDTFHQGVRFNDALYENLRDWVIRNYRDELRVADLRDPQLRAEVDQAFAELSRILNLPGSLFRLAS